MKRLFYTFLFIFTIILTSCSSGGSENTPAIETADTLALLVNRMQQCSRLYTTEYRIHKIIACETDREVHGMGLSIRLGIFGNRKVIIPLDATVKGYIDMSQVTEKHVVRQGKSIHITLPDPQVMMTGTRINHNEVKQYVTGFRDTFSDQELAAFETQGRQAIIDEIPSMGIEKAAQRDAARLLIPLLVQMGFDEEQIIITFRSDFQSESLTRHIES